MSTYNTRNPSSTRNIHPSAMRSITPAPTTTPMKTLTTLLSLTRTKLSLLYSLADNEESDFLRRSVLLQNVFDRAVIEREREVEREKIERQARYRESVLSGTARRSGTSGSTRGWKGQAFEVGMDALFEDDEEEEAQDQHQGMSIEIVDPLQYTTSSTTGPTMIEGEEAWFEQTWNELQADSSVPVHGDVQVDVYPVEEDDSMYSLSSTSSSRSVSPSSIDELDRDLDLELVPPPTPKLRPTKVDDKLDGPVEEGTKPAALECGVTVEWIIQRWEVLDEVEEVEASIEVDSSMGRSTQGGFVPSVNTSTTGDIPDEADDSDVYSDMDVPDLDSDVDEDDTTHPSAHLDRSSLASVSFDDADSLLVTPTEDALDDFDHDDDDEQDEQDYLDHHHQEDVDTRQVGLVQVMRQGKEVGLFARPGGGVRVVR